MRSNKKIHWLAAAAILPLAGVANAQTAPKAAAADTVGEVIVTAQKREQRLQDVPITIGVVSGQLVKDSGFRDVKDLALVAPGVTVSTSGAETQAVIRVRGIGTAGDNPGLESSVGVVIDGVYRPRNGVAFGDLGEIERMEVLKGPQGTLFGKNTSSGVINIVTAAPSSDFLARAEVGVANYKGLDVTGYVTGPLSDTVSASLFAARRKRDGFIHVNAGPGPRTESLDQDRDFYTLRGKLRFDASDTLRFDLIADYSKRKEHCCSAVPYIQGPTTGFIRALGGLPTTVPAPFDREAYLNRESPQNVEDKGVSLEMNYDTGILGDATLTAITAVRDWKVINGQDSDFTTADILYRNGDGSFGQQFKTISQELRLAGKAGRLNWLVGGFYANEKLIRNDSLLLGGDYSAYLSYLLTASVPAPYTPAPNRLGCFSAAVYSSACVVGLAPATGPVFAAGTGYHDLHRQTSNSFALFTNNSLQVTDALEATVGLRFTHEKKDVTSLYDNIGPANTVCASALANASPVSAKGPLCLAQTNPAFDGLANAQGRSEDAVTGTARLSYRFNPAVMVFGAYSRGYKSGGFNLDRVLNGFSPNLDTSFKAETVDGYEIGAKTNLFERRLQLNASIYYQTVHDFQVNIFQGLSYAIFTVPEVVTKGLDLDFVWRTPVPGLRVQGGFSYNDAKYGNFALPAFPRVPGHQLQFAPLQSGNLAIDYEKELSESLVLRTNVTTFVSAHYNTGGDLDPLRVQKGYTMVNGRIGLGARDERWTVEVWGRNLLDEHVVSTIFGSPFQAGSYSAFMGEPRTYGATLRLQF